MEYINDSTYLIKHSRKGTFAMIIKSQCPTWLNGIIAGGQADAILSYNEKFVGDDITIRKTHVTDAILQPGGNT